MGRNSLLRGLKAKVLGQVVEIGREIVDSECDGAHMEMQIVRVPFVHLPGYQRCKRLLIKIFAK